jgi:hypothetical protein
MDCSLRARCLNYFSKATKLRFDTFKANGNQLQMDACGNFYPIAVFLSWFWGHAVNVLLRRIVWLRKVNSS